MGEQPKIETAQSIMTSLPAATPFTVTDYDETKPKTYTWWYIGEYGELNAKKCRRLHCKAGSKHDLALFFENGKFYAVSAWCSHMGKSVFIFVCV